MKVKLGNNFKRNLINYYISNVEIFGEFFSHVFINKDVDGEEILKSIISIYMLYCLSSTALSIMKDTKIYKTWLLELSFIHI